MLSIRNKPSADDSDGQRPQDSKLGERVTK